jgi:hypothetical protein
MSNIINKNYILMIIYRNNKFYHMYFVYYNDIFNKQNILNT